MRIWRVEDSKGTGVYNVTRLDENGQEVSIINGDFRVSTTQHPGPSAERAFGWWDIYNREDYYFGFLADTSQLDDWFDEPMRAMCQPYVHVSEYYVPLSDVIVGSKQIIYLQSYAVHKIREFPL